MTLKPWREVAVPHRDIREARFDESTFAADLADVIADRGPVEYRDPETFFRKTYPTEGIVNLLAAVLSRLAGKDGEPVIQIQTPFGGGKTHSLVALYHLFKAEGECRRSELLERVLERSEVTAIPEAKVAVFVGTAADPLKGKTPWGAIAEQLGRYELLQEHDEHRRTPGKDLLHKLLGEAPVLILLDEIAQYVAKCVEPREIEKSGGSTDAGRAYQTQVLSFMQELTETVKVLPRAALVVTLPSSAPYGEEGELALQQLQRITGRMEAVYEPVKGVEIYEVIRKRLFEDVGDSREAKRVADAYWELYQRLGDEVPSAVREPAYRDKIRRAYPFHPELIDLLFERWSTIPTFQRTRGVLRLLAEVVADLYRQEHPAPLIQPAHVSLSNPRIRRELVKHIGNEYEGVIASDIANTNAKAQRIDRQMGSEYARFGVASGLAISIFLYSFSGSERKGAGIPQLRVALLREGIPAPIVGDALHHLKDVLWYLWEEGGFYWFSTEPNPNRIIVEREDVIDEDQIRQEIHERLQDLAGDEMRVYLYPRGPQDIPDTKELKLAVLADEQSSEEFIRDLLEKTSLTFRVYKNTLVVLVPDAGEMAELYRLVKRYLALRSIRDDKPLVKRLSHDNREALERKLRDAEKGIAYRLLSAYRRLFKLGAAGLEWFDLGLPTVGVRETLAKRVCSFMEARELLLNRIAPRHVLKVLGEETEKPFDDVYEAFLRYPNLPMLASRSVLEQAVLRGVEEGIFGLRVEDRVFFKKPVPRVSLDGAFLVNKEVIPEVSESEDGTAAGGEERKPAYEAEKDSGESSEGALRVAEPSETVGSLDWRIRLPWAKLSDFLRGVLLPLQQRGAEMELELHLRVHPKEDIGRLKDQIYETLEQIGAELEERDSTDSS